MLKRRLARFFIKLLLISIIFLFGFHLVSLGQTTAQEGQSVQTEQTVLEQEEAVTGIPPNAVTLEGKILFQVDRAYGSETLEERANQISERLLQIANNPQVTTDSIQALSLDQLRIIGAKWGKGSNLVLMTVTADDANAANQSITALTESHLQAIRAGIIDFRKDRSLENILKGIGYAALTTGLFFLSIQFFNRFFAITLDRLEHWFDRYGERLKESGSRFISLSPFIGLILRFAELGRNFLYLLLVCFYLFLILGFFPWTKGLSDNFWSIIWSTLTIIEQAVVAYLPKLVLLVLIFFITRELLAFIRLFFREIELGNIAVPWFYTDWVQPTFQLVRVLILALAIAISLPFIPGFRSPAFQGVSLLLSALFTLGAASAVANIVGGVVAVYTRAFLLGDMIQIGDMIGIVVEKNLLVTRIRTPKNVVITIPNSTVTNSNIINYSALARDQQDDTGLILHTTITLGYDVPWKTVNDTLTQAAIATNNILKTPAPFVLQTSLNDYHVSYELNAYTDNPAKMPAIYSALHQNIQDKCNEVGIEILSPSYLAMRDGNHSTIPENYLPNDYETPGFQIGQIKSN